MIAVLVIWLAGWAALSVWIWRACLEEPSRYWIGGAILTTAAVFWPVAALPVGALAVTGRRLGR